MLTVTEEVVVPDGDLSVRFVRSGGPGGQNVNKLATKVELRFALQDSEALRAAAKARLRAAFPSHVTDEGLFLVTSSRYRSQARNRQDAEEKLAEMIRGCLVAPRARRATRVPRGQKRARLQDKRKRAELKRNRRGPTSLDTD